MAAHVPVVATSVGGIPEIVSDQRSALLVPAGNAEKLATAILRVLQNPGLADSLVMASAALVDLNHSPAARVRRLCDLYREMAAEQ
jgi:glycosyltransferase involved in cell wall biosynthesis